MRELVIYLSTLLCLDDADALLALVISCPPIDSLEGVRLRSTLNVKGSCLSAQNSSTARESMAGSGRSLLEALEHWAAAQPDKVLHTFLDDRGDPVSSITYRGLLDQSAALAATLLAPSGSSSSSSGSGAALSPSSSGGSGVGGCGLKPGDRALLVFPPSLDFIVAFYACLRAGVIAVPVFPPGE